MIVLKEKYKCCGCGVCSIVCPRRCITMTRDSEGFTYPVTDYDSCVNCGLCEESCPIQNPCETYPIVETYAFKHIDTDIRVKSASGGAFTALSQYVIRNRGTVYGVIYDEHNQVVFNRATNMQELEKMRSSKYIQSDIFLVCQKIKEDLDKTTNPVLVSGTPCQIQAVKKYLKKGYSNLITVDLVCHGVSSPKVWEKYIKETEEKNYSRIVSYSFRNKKYGYHKNGTYIKFANGKEIYLNDDSNRKDFMHLAYYSKISSRPSCYHCEFKSRNRTSDFTIFDCWSLAQFDKNMEDDLGASSVFVHTQKAIELLKYLNVYGTWMKIDTERIIELDGVNVLYSMIPHKQRQNFMDELDSMSIDQLQDKYLKEGHVNILYGILKKAIVKLGLLNTAQKIKFSISRNRYQRRER